MRMGILAGSAGTRASHRGRARARAAVAALALLAALNAAPAAAFEALDGRFQAHGYFESQMRAISADYGEDWDVVQWYNVFNLELELDILSDPIGWVDLVSGYIRAEVRYDCVYSRGCGMFRSMNMIGDRAQSLPRRLMNAHTRRAAGAILLDDDTGRIQKNPLPPIVDPVTGKQTPNPGKPFASTDPVPFDKVDGFARLAEENGLDDVFGNPRGQSGCISTFTGAVPGLSGRDVCRQLAGSDEGPFRLGSDAQRLSDDPFSYVFELLDGYGFTHIQGRGGGNNGNPIQRLGPWYPNNFIYSNAGLADRVNPFDNTRRSPTLKAALFNSAFTDSLSVTQGDLAASKQIAREGKGGGALPYRPIPVENEGRNYKNDGLARGLYMPSEPVGRLAREGKIDEFTELLNFRESERAWNRGASQQDEKELKEAYIDIEMFESRLWLRLGKQNIVWGKTELFRTTDQFNPQDLALASLPSLEESRIPLWAFRSVYSFYEVGPLEDVRLELAFNYDDFESSDLGACGEAYTINLVCQGAFGAVAHSTTGIGLAGARFPEDPWDGIQGWEVGGRVEWRWDRFSFAISDFYGYADFPYIERISTYERNVDVTSGRPRVMGARGNCVRGDEAACLMPGPTRARQTSSDPRGYRPNDPDLQVANPAFTQTDPYQNTPNRTLRDERNALNAHHANLQVMAMVCSTTIGVQAIDPTACAQTLFGSPREPLDPLDQIPGKLFTVGQITSSVMAGGVGATLFLASQFGVTLPVVRLDQGPNDLDNPLSNGLARIVARRGSLPAAKPECLDSSVEDQALGGRSAIGIPCGGVPAAEALRGFARSTGVDPSGAALAQALSPEQEAMMGCGPLWGTNCDDSGIDLLNLEGSALLQSFVGFEGTVPGWRTDGIFRDAQGKLLISKGDLGRLRQQGMVVQTSGGPRLRQPGTLGFVGGPVCPSSYLGGPQTANARLPGCRGYRFDRNGNPVPQKGYDPLIDGDPQSVPGHPLALGDLAGNPQAWQNELAALSWNFFMISSVFDADFDTANPLPAPGTRKHKCNLATPQNCGNVQGLFRLGGISRPDIRAGGNLLYGRRTFQWQNGGEVLIRFEKRNVLGFSSDWAVDALKSNFSMEFTWIEGVPTGNTESTDGLIEVDQLNLTFSADRPTFINFLNANRTFFFNTQWFFGYADGWKYGTAGNAWSVLATFAVSTGYYQDRLLPSAAFVYDFQSVSGAALPQVTYRYNERFSITVGANVFMGGAKLEPMSINPIAMENRLGKHQYKDQSEPGLSVFRDRDEVFVSLRYTF